MENATRYDITQHLMKHLSTNENITKINMQQIFKHDMTRRLDKINIDLVPRTKWGVYNTIILLLRILCKPLSKI